MTRAAFTAATALGAAMLGGCSGSPAIAPSLAPSLEASLGAPPAPVPGFVIDANFPDPDVVVTPDGYAAFATGQFGTNIQSATSSDMQTWQAADGDALPKLPLWATTGRTWAPDVSVIGGQAVMYFTAEHVDSGRQCIGAATAPAVSGPFVPTSDEPLVCPLDAGGAIDASTFTDVDGKNYLLFKTDGNCCGLDTWIEIAPLSADGLSLAGEPSRLIKQTLAWEGNLVEAPVLVRHNDSYVLFYSANDYSGDAYAIGAATSQSLLGPYEKQPEPVLSTTSSDGRYLGPGGQDVVPGTDGDTLVFHSWDEQYIYRGINVAPLTWGPTGISVTPPTGG